MQVFNDDRDVSSSYLIKSHFQSYAMKMMIQKKKKHLKIHVTAKCYYQICRGIIYIKITQ